MRTGPRPACAAACAIAVLVLSLAARPASAEGLSSLADAFAPRVASFLEGLHAAPGETRGLDVPETLALIGVGAKQGMNAFELFDAVHRWAVSAGVRFRLEAAGLREAARVYDIGRERVRSLLPLDLMTGLEVGAALSPGQAALSATLAAPYSEYVEIGTIKLAESFGFAALEPDRYLKPYGISVSRFPVSASLNRLELYAPHKGAIYVNGLPRPKRWNLWPITKR
jgi:hypothetical protein